MHVPDGYLPLLLLGLMYLVSGIALFIAVRKINKKFDEKMVPYMGVLAAVIFAAQFVNFPVGPFSGHLVGSTLLGVMVGPYAGLLIMALVLFVQALYGDGGILAYGLNVFNMGVFGTFFGWALAFLLFKGLKKYSDEKKAVLAATTVSSYVTTIAMAAVLGIQLLTVPGFEAAYSIMLVAHVFIGIGEAVLTFAILLYFVRARPKLISFLSDSETSEMAKIRDAKQQDEIVPVIKEV
jgi:cobalt/nickel transport system permease protein